MNVSLPCKPAKTPEPVTPTELMSKLNGKKMLQSKSDENWSIQASVPRPATPSIVPVNVSVPVPVVRPVWQLMSWVKSATAVPVRSPLYELVKPVVLQRIMKPEAPTCAQLKVPGLATVYVPETLRGSFG